MMEQPVTTSMLLPKELYKRAREFAKAQDRSMGYVFRQALETYLEDNHPTEQAERETAQPTGKGKATK